MKAYDPVTGLLDSRTDPEEYSYDDLERESSTVWSGVTDYLALKFLRDIDAARLRPICHPRATRPELVGIARVISDAYPDPTRTTHPMAFDLEPVRRLSLRFPWPSSPATPISTRSTRGHARIRRPAGPRRGLGAHPRSGPGACTSSAEGR